MSLIDMKPNSPDPNSIELSDTPLLLIDVDRAEQNSRKMSAGLNEQGIRWRPHIKTHKSVFFAKKQLEWGASGITCSSVGEAEVMAGGGLDDIYIAYPLIGDEKLRRYLALTNKVRKLSCLVNSLYGAAALNAAFTEAGKKADILVEIDGRMGRGGIALESLPGFLDELSKCSALNLVGAASFCGKAGSLPSEAERREDARIEAANLVKAGELLRDFGCHEPVLSGGSSVSSRYPDCLAGITEARAGTCIFNDMTHVSMGNCTIDECAAEIVTTVVTAPYDGRFIVDAGSKTLSTDICRHRGYGYIREYGERAWIEALNEEHGICDIDGQNAEVGRVLHIIPNHVCVAINLTDRVVCKERGRYFYLPVDARGIDR